MKKKHAIIMLSVLLAVILFALGVQIAAEGEITDQILIRTMIPLALCLLGFVKVLAGTGKRLQDPAVFEKEYGDVIRTAFSGEGNRRSHRQLLEAVDLFDREQYAQAVRRLEPLLDACRTTDDYCAVFMFLALSNAKLDLTEKAIAAYRSLLSHDNTRSRAWSNLGSQYRKLGRNADALNCFQNALQHDGSNPYAYNNLAAVCYAMGDDAAAVAYAQKALELKGDLYQASNTACLACYAMYKVEEGEKWRKISVANGADGAQLQAAIEQVFRKRPPTQSPVPLSVGVRKALQAFRRETGLSFVHACIPFDGGKSRFGGPPIDPPPVDSAGKPMRLLCALYCSEIRNVPDFPASGILQFYIGDNGCYGADFLNPTVQKDFRVVYTADEDAPVLLTGWEPETDTGRFPVTGTWPIRFEPDIYQLTAADHRFADTMSRCLQEQGEPAFEDQEEDVQEALCSFCNGEGHRVGGYPHFNQWDPRQDHPELRKYDTLLLQIDTHEGKKGPYIMIGDHGVMNFFIPREKLRQKDFSDVLYWWDCQ